MHTKPGSIVVGVDGSESSDRALRWAIQQAVLEHRPLTVVHASLAATEPDPDAVVTAACTTVEHVAPGLEVQQVRSVADPRQALLQLSADAAMVVVGSRGRRQLRSLVLGSVSVAVVRHAHCPVVVVRPANAGAVRNGIVVGIDASPESRPVLEFAYREAALRDLPLLVLDCVSDPGPGTEEQRLALAEVMAGMSENYPEVHVTARVANASPQKALVGLGVRMDLIVVGAHQHSRIAQTLFGSVSVSVVENAACTVAVVPTTSRGMWVAAAETPGRLRDGYRPADRRALRRRVDLAQAAQAGGAVADVAQPALLGVRRESSPVVGDHELQ
jgi:nucleotide-binding universal stress UspA family protein